MRKSVLRMAIVFTLIAAMLGSSAVYAIPPHETVEMRHSQSSRTENEPQRQGNVPPSNVTPTRSPLSGHTSGWALPESESGGIFMMAFDMEGRHIELPTFDDLFGLGQSSLSAAIEEAFPLSRMTVEDVAHMDFDESLPHIQNLILRSRYEMVFCNSVSWTVDGQMEIIDIYGNVTILPEFSDLFPTWNLAQIESIRTIVSNESEMSEIASAQARWLFLFRRFIHINPQHPTQLAPVFQTVTNPFNRWAVMDVQLDGMDAHIRGVNIGINNMTAPGQPSIGWAGGMRPWQFIRVHMGPFTSAGVRASTIDHPGFVTISGWQQ